MVAWLTVKTVFKKAWVWIKKNWTAPVVVIYTLVLWLVFRRGDRAYEVLQARDKSYKSQIKAITDAHEAEIAKRNEVIAKYTEIISALEKEYSENKLVLENKKKKEIKKIVEEYKDDPEGLAKTMSEKFGFLYTKKENV
jgi:hypothetical protein